MIGARTVKLLENMGLKSGNILEPSCGVGNFIGMKPESLSDCKIYGVELDSVSGRIAAQLYQKSKIAIEGYEKANLPDSFLQLEMYRLESLNYLTTGMTDTIFSFTIISLQRHWTR